MLVSGGKIIAIDGVNTTSATLSGDGVFTPLGVNTDNVATKKFVTDNLNTVSSKLTNTDNYLSAAIDYVSANAGKTYKPGAGIEIDNNNVVSISSDYIDAITSVSAIKGTIITGDSNFNITSSNSGKNILWNLELTSQPVVTDTTLSGYNGIIARKDSTVSSQWNVGLDGTYKSAIEQVSGKLDKSDSAKFYPAENPSGFITGIPTSSNWDSVYSSVKTNSGTWNNVSAKVDTTAMSAYYKKTETSSKEEIKNEFNATSAWANVTFLPSGDYLSANALNNLSGKWQNASDEVEANSSYWNETTQKVNDSANTWNTVTAKADQTDLETLSSNVENISADVETISSNLDNKLNKNDFTAWSATIDTAFYSAGEGLALNNHTFSISAKYLSANALDNVSGNWNSVYNTVSSNSAKWDNLTAINTFSSIGGVSARNSADELLFEPGDNVSITTANNTITFSAKDTTYDENDFISASHLDNIVSVSATVKSNSANWNDVSSKANSADLTALSSKVNNLSGELNTTSSFLSGAIDVVSAEFEKVIYTSASAGWDVTPYSAGQNINITNHTISGKDWTDTIKEASANAVTTVENKFNGENNTITAYGTSSFANDKYTAGIGLALNDHQFYVSGKYITSAGDSLSGKMLILKDNEWVEMPEFGGFATANSGEGHPDVQNPSTKLIYLVKNSTVTGNDKYSEWIYTSADAQTTAWECIGDTSLDLTPYLTKTEAEDTYQRKGNYVTSSTSIISANETYGLTNDGNTIKWVKLEDNDTTYTAGKNIVISGNNNEISVSGLHNTTLTSTDDSVGITATTDASGNIQYDLGVNTIPGISGISGVSAYYDESSDQYIVGLENYNEIGFAKFSTSSNVFTTSAVVNGYNEDLNVNPTKITLTNDKILLKKGFYHIDAQTNFNVTTADNNYYDVIVKSIPTAATITQMIDGSYAHTETVDLSFDIRITTDDTPIEISVENFKTNETFAISNLNIHEIVSMPSQIEGGAGNYQAGNGISIGNDTIAAKIGNGLEFNESNAIQVKLGKGLKFDDSQGVQAVTIDSDVNEVVETVQELQESLDTKITDNYPPAMITIADLQVANQTQYAPSNGGMLIGYLFTCPITHKIYAGSNNDYKTKIGIYTKQWSGDNKKVILGIYEYQPDYVNPDTQQVGKTEALCDTGIIELQQGYAEYDVKNLGTKTIHEMKPGCFYYATIYLSYKAGDTNGITLFGAPGYNTQVNNLKPGITITNVNCIHASLYEGLDGYSPNLNFDQMGFSWQYNSYPPSSTSDPYTSQGIVEAHAAGRPYFAIRNVKIVTGN